MSEFYRVECSSKALDSQNQMWNYIVVSRKLTVGGQQYAERFVNVLAANKIWDGVNKV